MDLGLKLEVLIRREGYKKVDFAKEIGITYRALANYLAGTRTPRKDVAIRMSKRLNIPADLLLDPRQSITMNSEERFLFGGSSDSNPSGISMAADFLKKAKTVFANTDLNGEDKQALFACLTEIYFNAKDKKTKELLL